MESDNCPAKEFCSSSSDAHSNLNCNGDSVVEGGHLAFNAASRVPNPEFEDLDSFNLIEPPPLDWRSDSSSEAGSVHEMDDPTFSPSSVTVDTPEGGSALPLDVSDAAVLPGVNQVELVKKLPEDSMEQSYGAREQVEEQDGDEKVEEAENFGDEEFEKVEERRPGDEDHTRIQVLLNRLQLIGESSLHDDSTLQNPSLVYAASSDLNLSDPSLTTGGGTLPVAPLQNQASGLLFSESHQRDLVGLLECTEIGAPQHLEAQAARGPRGDIDAVVSVSYSQEDGERFWDHYGNGQHRLRNDSMVSLPEDEDEVPEPVWMKLGEEPPEEAGAAEGSEQRAEDHPAYKDVPGPCDPEDLLDGVIFGANYLGSTQLKSEKNPSTNARMAQAQEAVDRIKAPEGESQPTTEVDLFISTQRIKVLSADTQEAMMDHSLQMISYIADIGNIVVLMARRKPAGRKERDASQAVNSSGPQKKCCMICHVFTSADAQVIAQAIGQAFGVAYQQFLQANGIKASELRPSEYSDYLGTQELYNGDLVHFSDSDNIREVPISKAPGEIMGLAVVESGWGSILPTVVVANLLHGGPAERSGALSIGDRIMSVNGTSLVGLPIATCQSIIRDLKNQDGVKLSIVHCPPVTMAIIKRPDPKFQLGFSVEDGIICSLMRGGIAERGGIRVGHRIIEINGQSVVATPHDKIINILTNAVGEIHLKTMPASTYRLLTGQEQPIFL
ncbi:amyloid-beta A4 precursor protein-binding family A member 3 [Hypomesus transpacificus]|uniref:amyloid-beta A4 precursor protein-binding family A member 3 n=1 Tax=Hypomesus transpacificus TaxID=137520 RepID=UPI001F07CFA7|nr:amyloid-beta A4 precursor protein-binding family A member 3 [Hypomesus transpacificus]